MASSRTVEVRTAQGQVLAARVRVAQGVLSRFWGLMGRSHIDPEEGLWLKPCRNVHMLFMRTALDIVYLDRQWRVVRSVPQMPKWSVQWLPVRGAHSTLELAPGTLARLGVEAGEQLRIDGEAAPAGSLPGGGAIPLSGSRP